MSEWQPLATPEALNEAARLRARIRDFFSRHGVTEVITPVLTASGVSDIHIDSLEVAEPTAYLRTSPEYAHKRLLAAGFGDLYEMGPVFRAGEAGTLNRSEFTLLEWYRIGWQWRELAEEVVELIVEVAECTRQWPVRFLSWRECMAETLGFDPLDAPKRQLREAAGEVPANCDRDALLDWIMASRVQPTLAAQTITVVHGYPASQAALARLDPENPALAERFEVFAGSIELANGYRELTDVDQQRARFEADNRRRSELGKRPMPIDERLLAAMQSGLPECAGVALGVDRLILTALDLNDIRHTASFCEPV